MKRWSLPISKTLRPCREESVNFDITKNIFIEGDNLDALKLLQESYLGKVKMIYIDPPYNTGKDFVYSDNFTADKAEFHEASGQMDEEGGRLVANTDSNGRFHSDWLTMIYSRLRLAKNLLSNDGILFISIDDNENFNLRKICEEVFGESNFVAELVWHLSSGPQAGHFTRANESIIAFSKSKENLPFFPDTTGGTIKHGALKKISKVNPASEVVFPKGSIKIEGPDAVFPNEIGGSEKQFITNGTLEFKNGELASDVTISAGWGMKNQLVSWLNGEETFDSKGQKVLRFYFNAQGILFYEKERGTYHPKTVIPSTEVGGTKAGGDDIRELFGENIMSFPKPVKLIQFLARLCTAKDDLILDFFAGSGTTAHATMKLNAEDRASRRYISVQLPETVAESSEAYKAGYKNIAEISKERIRRAGKKVKEENTDKEGIGNLDIGFRVFKIDSSNMQDVHLSPDETKPDMLVALEGNIKTDRTGEDLLFQVLLDWGVDLSLSIESQNIDGKTVYFVDDNALAACFDENINEDFVKILAEKKPLRVVFRDDGFASDSVKINVEQIFKLKSPSTDIRVI